MESATLLDRELRYLKGVGEKRAALFARLGVDTVRALLSLYPRAYTDYSQPVEIAAAPLDTPVAVRATVYSKGAQVRVRGGKTLQKIAAGDDSGPVTITYFNNPYSAGALKEGQTYVFYGRLRGNLLQRELVAPTFVPADAPQQLVPVYPLTTGLSSKIISIAVQNALSLFPAGSLPDPLPAEMRERLGLLPYDTAVRAIHRPADLAEAAAARRRLSFDELFLLQLGLLGMRQQNRVPAGARVTKAPTAPFYATLPFSPTGAQKRAVEEILADLSGQYPMNRLLQGDVGSGKTLVAAAAFYAAAKSGFQGALMAPTEILATQHADTLSALLAPFGVEVVLLTGSTKGTSRKKTLEKMASNTSLVAVGTHALLSDTVTFGNLGLVVADEQHRFGVTQRAKLAAKGAVPHLLVMSATPIPRTLSLILYGDLDISVLDEMPKGRLPIKTYAVTTALRGRMFGFLQKEINAGHQVYIVCPVIEEGETELQSVKTYYEEVAGPLLPGASIGLLHGRMKGVDKTEMLAAFSAGKLDVLCATPVIEVGIDVPNATVMVIENAERYGLSALHQLRGRVGRGKDSSYCILVSDNEGAAARERLQFLSKTQDGFKVAQYDLDTRGPGDFIGARQHGLPIFRVADLATDMPLLQAAQQEAKALLEQDPRLASPQHAALAQAAQALFAAGGGRLFS